MTVEHGGGRDPFSTPGEPVDVSRDISSGRQGHEICLALQDNKEDNSSAADRARGIGDEG